MDVTLNISFLLTLLLIGSYAVYSKQLTTTWNNRKDEFFSIRDSWNPIILVSTLISVIVVYFLVINREAPKNVSTFFYEPNAITMSVIAMLGLLTFVSALSACTDFLVSRAPSEPSDLLFLLSVPFMLYFGGFKDVISTTVDKVDSSGITGLLPGLGEGFATADWSGLLSAGIWFLCPLLLFPSFQAGKIGDADLTYLVVITSTVSWWAGWYVTFMLFGIGCFLQICMYFVFQKMNLGESRKVRPDKTMLAIKRLIVRFNPSSSLDVSGKKVTRYYTPLLPALAIAYVVGLTFLLITGNEMLLVNGGIGIFGT